VPEPLDYQQPPQANPSGPIGRAIAVICLVLCLAFVAYALAVLIFALSGARFPFGPAARQSVPAS
jgi:hypothetical protein